MLLSFAITFFVLFFNSQILALDLVPITDPTDPDVSLKHAKRDASFTGELALQDLETFFWGVPCTPLAQREKRISSFTNRK